MASRYAVDVPDTEWAAWRELVHGLPQSRRSGPTLLGRPVSTHFEQPSTQGANIRLVIDNLPPHTTASLDEALDPPEAQSIADQ